MPSGPGGSAAAERGAWAAPTPRNLRPAHARLAIVVFLALMGLMAARYAGLEHDPRRAATAHRSIAQTFATTPPDIRLVTPLDPEEGAGAALRRTGTTNHDPALLEAGDIMGGVRLHLVEESLFEPATGRLRDDAKPRVGRLVERVLGTRGSRLEIFLNERDLQDPTATEKIERLVTLIQSMGLPPSRVAFGSGPTARSTWLLEAGGDDPP